MIPISFVRSSSYGSHEMCEMKYFGEYVLGWQGKSNLAADMGTIVHKVMEVLANIKLAEQKGKDSFVDDVVGECSRDTTTVDQIIDKVFEYYSQQFDHHFWGSKEYKTCVKWTYKALEFNNGQFHPYNQDIVKPEQHFDIEMKSDWAKYKYLIDGEEVEGRLRVKGTIDLITKVDDNTHEIIDYKTGKDINWATDEEKNFDTLQKDFQLRLYHFAHSILYPDVDNILVTIYFIKFDKPVTLMWGRADIPDTIDMIRKKFEQIRDTENPKPTYSYKCKRFCHFGKETFEDKDGVKPLVAGPDCKLSIAGENMKMCDQILYSIKHRGIDLVSENMTKEGHDPTHYKAPGDV